MAPTKLDTVSKGSFSDPAGMRVHICKAENPSISRLWDAADGLEHALDQLFDDNRIDGYKLDIWDTDCNLDCGLIDDMSDMRKAWNDYRDIHGLDEVGVWELVHNCDRSFAVTSGISWGTDTHAFVSTNWNTFYNKTTFQGMTVHEMLHTFISTECPYISDLTDGEESDHALGHDHYHGGDYHRSPLAIWYDPELGDDCTGSNASDSAGNTHLSSCEFQAVQLYAQHYNDEHNHNIQ